MSIVLEDWNFRNLNQRNFIMGSAVQFAFNRISSFRSKTIRDLLCEELGDDRAKDVIENLQVFRANSSFQVRDSYGTIRKQINAGQIFGASEIPSEGRLYVRREYRAVETYRPRVCLDCRMNLEPRTRRCVSCGSENVWTPKQPYILVGDYVKGRDSILRLLLNFMPSLPDKHLAKKYRQGSLGAIKRFRVERRQLDAAGVVDGMLHVFEVKSTTKQKFSSGVFSDCFFYPVLILMIQQEHGVLLNVRTDRVTLVYYGKIVNPELSASKIRDLEEQYESKLELYPIEVACRSRSYGLCAVVVSYTKKEGYSYAPLETDAPDGLSIIVESANPDVMYYRPDLPPEERDEDIEYEDQFVPGSARRMGDRERAIRDVKIRRPESSSEEDE